MPLAAKDLKSSRSFFVTFLHGAQELIAIYRESPRIGSIFAAQQRWLMAHAGFALYYGYPDDPRSGLYSERFAEFVLKHRIASRNTGAAFIQEMLAYRFVRPMPNPPDRRTRLLEPTETAVEHFHKWLHLHLLLLDGLDQGHRAEALAASPATFGIMQPLIAKRIIDSDAVRNPGAAFNLFNWANSGGLVMDYLMSRIDPSESEPRDKKIVIGLVSMREISEGFMISNTHLKRLISQAVGMGSLGWVETAGKSSLWISSDFVAEYWSYQAEKFAVIDAVAQAVLGTPYQQAAGPGF